MRTNAQFVLSLGMALLLALAVSGVAAAQEPAESEPSAAQTETTDGGATAPPGAAQEDPATDDFEDLPGAEEDEAVPAEDDEAEPADEKPASEEDEAGDTAQSDNARGLNCDDFDKQKAAQDYFTDEGGDDDTNVDGLDADGDGVACEALSAPSGGVDAGAGGTVPRPDGSRGGPLLFLLGGAGFGLAVGGYSLVGRRRRVSE
jgi:hypothetical protein